MEIQEIVEEIKDEMIRIRRHIHAHPELSHEEYETTQFVKDQLKDTSIEWQELGLETGAVGLMRGNAGEGPVLMLRADLDALPIDEESGVEFKSEKPNVMHACGHDVHTTVLIGAAKVLERTRDEWKGTIKFVFQPSEERAGGATELIEAGVLENPKPDHAVCLHTWPSTDAGKIGIRPGPMTSANDTFHVTVKGTGGHGAHPEKSVDPIPVAGDVVDMFQRIISRNLSPFEPAVITAGQIDGGTANNVIATKVNISGTVRTLNQTTRDYIKKRMAEIAHHVAAASNAEAEVDFKGAGCPPVINDPHLTGLLEQSLKDRIGDENIDYLKVPSTGSEDFAYYLEHIPGMLFRLGTRDDEDSRTHLPLHNPGIVFDERAIPTGITAMSGFAIDYLNGVH